jgi:hypothetical protein
MARLVDLKTFTDIRGNLTVIERIIPFEIKRIFYIYGVDNSVRGGHRHHKTYQAAIALKGSCIISNNDGNSKETFVLDNPAKCLLLASEYFDFKDYIFEMYK